MDAIAPHLSFLSGQRRHGPVWEVASTDAEGRPFTLTYRAPGAEHNAKDYARELRKKGRKATARRVG